MKKPEIAVTKHQGTKTGECITRGYDKENNEVYYKDDSIEEWRRYNKRGDMIEYENDFGFKWRRADKTTTQSVREYLRLNQKISRRHVMMLGAKNPYSPISYLRKEGWEIEARHGVFYLVSEPKQEDFNKEFWKFFWTILILSILTGFILFHIL